MIATMLLEMWRDTLITISGSQLLEVDKPQNRGKHNLATHIVPKHYFNTGFGDLKLSAYDPKVVRDPPVEKHCL